RFSRDWSSECALPIHGRDHGGTLTDLLVGEAQGNRPHLLSGEILGVEPALAAAEFTQLLFSVPDRQSRDGGAEEFLLAFPVLPRSEERRVGKETICRL